MKRFLRIALLATSVLLLLLVLAYVTFRGPSPEAILADLERPDAPVLTPAQALDAFRVAPGFRVELVAAEPLVVDPVAMDWDDEGRLYVVEMRGFMPDVDGNGEDQAVGRVVILEDKDGDGRMDTSQVFADGLVLPRSIQVLPEGVLIAAPPNLWLCKDTTGDQRCDKKHRLGEYAAAGPNVEHRENGLLAGIDGWLYNAKSDRRLRLVTTGSDEREAIDESRTPFRGQWGIAQDDEGLLYYNHNSGFLYGEIFPGEYAMRQAATRAQARKPGINVPLTDGEQVWGIRVAPGLNRAYKPGTLRADGRQDAPTAVSGLVIQRGDQYGDAYLGDAFVPESGGNAVAHFALTRDGLKLSAEHRLYPDEDWGSREFLASTDERFRPVDARVGPDGTVWVIDMYRGVIQHAYYVSDYLRDYALSNDLVSPGARGRIWRLVREDQPIERDVSPLVSLEERLVALDHSNGWVRDRAQRRLVSQLSRSGTGDASGVALRRLRSLDFRTPLGRVHALWTLAGLGELDVATWRRALADPDPRVRRAALRTGEPLLRLQDSVVENVRAVEALLVDPDPGVGLQALHSLTEAQVPDDHRHAFLEKLAATARRGSELIRHVVLSGLAGVEQDVLRIELAVAGRDAGSDDRAADAWLSELAGGAHRAAQQHIDVRSEVTGLLDLIFAAPYASQALMLDGIAAAQRFPGSRRVELASAHPVFAELGAGNEKRSTALTAALARARPHFTWPGDPRPGGARALTQAEEARRVAGLGLYASSCASCHGLAGVGQVGLAPSLVGSSWVRDSDDWLVRIALHGLTGPVVIEGHEWNLTMPGHGFDPRFDDEGLAGVLTHLRRAWGHGEDPINPATIAAIRKQERDRKRPWTIEELRGLPIAHRLDRYIGEYKVPVVSLSLFVERNGDQLTVGRGTGESGEIDELGRHTFGGQGMSVIFLEDESGTISGARVDFQGTTFTVSRVEAS